MLTSHHSQRQFYSSFSSNLFFLFDEDTRLEIQNYLFVTILTIFFIEKLIFMRLFGCIFTSLYVFLPQQKVPWHKWNPRNQKTLINVTLPKSLHYWLDFTNNNVSSRAEAVSVSHAT